jgi:2-polyprenyl-3-methyl-5-hydroxy-6-metoxy-1,4-benzoquinol methylase
MIEVKICPVCQSAEWQSVFPVKDHSISKETFDIKRCRRCSMTVTSPRPAADHLSRYYQSEEYISHSGKSANGIVSWAYLIARQYSLKRKLTLVNKLQPKGKALDIGCGTGEFLNTLKKAGWETMGVEPSSDARSKAEALTRQSISQSLDKVEGTFNVITLWHVLEHLPDLDHSMKQIQERLESRGTLLIAVPNHESFDAKKYGEYWAGYDVPRHLWHFSQKTMVSLLQKYAFKLTQTIPMKLDAYYVSALSEKYKSGGSSLGNLGNAFFSGLASNREAQKTGEYSSLIYIAEK